MLKFDKLHVQIQVEHRCFHLGQIRNVVSTLGVRVLHTAEEEPKCVHCPAWLTHQVGDLVNALPLQNLILALFLNAFWRWPK